MAVVAPRSDTCAYFADMVDFGLESGLTDAESDTDFALEKYDEGCVPEDAVATVQRVIADGKPDVMVGPAISGNVSANVERLNAEQIPMLTGAYLPSLTQAGSEYIFRTVPHDGQLYGVLAQTIADQGHSKVGIVVHASAYGEGARETFAEQAEAVGLETDASAGTFQSGTTDFSGQLLKLKNADVDSIFFAAYDLDLGLLVRQARQLGLEQPIYGAPTMSNKEFLDNAGDAAEGVVFVSNFVLNDPETDEFAQSYSEKYSQPATNNTVGYYLAGAVLADVYERTDADASAEEVRDAVAATDIDTIFGPVQFEENGDMVDPRIVVGTIKDGQPAVLEGTS